MTIVLFAANGFVIISFCVVTLWYYMKQKSKHIVQWMPCALPLIQFAMRAEETLRRTADPDIGGQEEADLRYEWSHILPTVNGRLFTKGTAYTLRKRIRQAGLQFGDAFRKAKEHFTRERGDTRGDETAVDLSIAPNSPVVEALASPRADVPSIVSVDNCCDGVIAGGSVGGELTGADGSGGAVGGFSSDGGGGDGGTRSDAGLDLAAACDVGRMARGSISSDSVSNAEEDEVGAHGHRGDDHSTSGDIVEARESCAVSFAAALVELSVPVEGSDIIRVEESRLGSDVKISLKSAVAKLALKSKVDEDTEIVIDFDTSASTSDSLRDGDSSGSAAFDLSSRSESDINSSDSDGEALISSALFAHPVARAKEKRDRFAL